MKRWMKLLVLAAVVMGCGGGAIVVVGAGARGVPPSVKLGRLVDKITLEPGQEGALGWSARMVSATVMYATPQWVVPTETGDLIAKFPPIPIELGPKAQDNPYYEWPIVEKVIALSAQATRADGQPVPDPTVEPKYVKVPTGKLAAGDEVVVWVKVRAE